MSASESRKQPRPMSAQEIAELNSEFERMERSIQGYVDQRLAGIGQKNPNQVVAVARSRPSLAIPLVLGLAMVLIGLLIWRVMVLERTVARLEAWAPAPAGAAAATGGPAAAGTTPPVVTENPGSGPTLAPLGTFVNDNRPALAAMIEDLVAGEGVAPGSVAPGSADKLGALARMLAGSDPLAAKDLTTIRDGLFEYQVHRAWEKEESPPSVDASIDARISSEEYPLESLAPLWSELNLAAPEVLDETVRQRVVRAAILAAR